MRTLYTLSTNTSTVSNVPNILTNTEPYKLLHNIEEESTSIKVPHCCENCPSRPTKDEPMRACFCVLPSLEQIKW